jgi:large conductance mechanosensitive channel
MKKVEVKKVEVKKIKENKILKEFKDFISKGNVMDLAVGVIIGASFQNIVTSLTNNIINPLLGCFTEVDFSDYVLKIGTLNIRYGSFITDVINFVIMAFIVFLMVKFVNKIFKKEEAKEETPAEPKKSNEELLLEEIRDILKSK